MEHKPVQKFTDRNELYFVCSTPNCNWRFQFVVDPKHPSPKEWADFESQISKSFEKHGCGESK